MTTIGRSIPSVFAVELETAVKTSIPESENIDEILLFKRDSISAKKYVGVVGTKNCTLEILPKIDSENSRNDKAIRKRLVHMLSVAFNTKINDGTLTNIDWEKNPHFRIFD